MLSFITWDWDPTFFSIGSLEIRYYGLCWALSFYIAYVIVKKMIVQEGMDEKLMVAFLYAILIGAVLGARLGHVFFYDWAYYKDHLGEILNIRQGGLASHGGTLGVLLGAWWFAKYKAKKSLLWTLDKIVPASALAATLIRLGNFFNSEIIGDPTGTDFGVVFAQLGEDFPRHPAQLYEAACYLLLFGILMWLYYAKKVYLKEGFLFGLFLVWTFTARFFIEFVKVSQGGFEESLGASLSTGQWLSFPFILVGIFYLFKASKGTPA